MSRARDLADGNFSGDLEADSPTFVVDSANNRVGVGTTSPVSKLEVKGESPALTINQTNTSTTCRLSFYGYNRGYETTALNTTEGASAGAGNLTFLTNPGGSGNITERMRINSDGGILIGTTDTSVYNNSGAGNGGVNIGVAGGTAVKGFIAAARDDGNPLDVNRLSTNGGLIEFRKDGSSVGSIDFDGSYLVFSRQEVKIGNNATGQLILLTSTVSAQPRLKPVADDAVDLGDVTGRFDDIWATNGTINTSDRNEKQDIEALSDAEQRVAVAAKGLMRKYRWKSAVEKKGDEARIHFGIIAQDLQAAFAAEGLDAGRYGMFTSSTWWEADRVIPAVEAQDAVYETQVDEDGNEVQVLVSEAVEAQPERVVTDTFETLEEAPEGAVQRTRMGVRYPELLAFIIAAL